MSKIIKCPLCGCLDYRNMFSVNGYNLNRCMFCDLSYIDPYPESKQKRFHAVSQNRLDDITVIGAQEYYLARQIYFKNLFPLIEPSLQGASSLLDIGCGAGQLLELVSEKYNITCTGLELSASRSAFARKQTGCEILEAPIEEAGICQKFDVITLIDVFSHVYSIDKMFKTVIELLNDGGKFVIKTGEITDDVSVGSVFDWEVPDHLHFMGMKTIDIIAQRYGFKVASHSRVAHVDELYTKDRFLTKGRSGFRNTIKWILAYTPYSIPMMKKRYINKYGKNVFSSTIVLTKEV